MIKYVFKKWWKKNLRFFIHVDYHEFSFQTDTPSMTGALAGF